MKAAALALLALAILAIGFAATQKEASVTTERPAVVQKSPQIQVPVLPTEPNVFGGRPGTFHFVTNEQTMQQAAALRKAFANLDDLEWNSRLLTGEDRRRVWPQIQELRAYLNAANEQRIATASTTAALVEHRLNSVKGNAQCGSCHSGGMPMHARNRVKPLP